MNADEFWAIVESARSSVDQMADDGGELMAEALTARLAATAPQTILEFQAQFDDACGPLYRWDVWAAAYLIGGGCSDDSFSDFRAGVVALGRDWWQRVLANPDELADHPLVRRAAAEDDDWALFAEPVAYVAADAYERLTGEDDCAFYEAWGASPYAAQGRADDEPDMGEDFDFDDDDEMQRRLPRLAALFIDQTDKD